MSTTAQIKTRIKKKPEQWKAPYVIYTVLAFFFLFFFDIRKGSIREAMQCLQLEKFCEKCFSSFHELLNQFNLKLIKFHFQWPSLSTFSSCHSGRNKNFEWSRGDLKQWRGRREILRSETSTTTSYSNRKVFRVFFFSNKAQRSGSYVLYHLISSKNERVSWH